MVKRFKSFSLLLLFFCVKGAFTQTSLYTITGPFNALACENSLVRLSCADGMVIQVKSSFYGRNDRSTCPSRRISATNCVAAGALLTVQDLCGGKSFCVVAASNSVFGDPCSGTTKYLEVEYNCKAPRTAIETIVHVCESNTAYVSCPLGQAIGVVDAFYGRDERSRCPANNGQNTACRREGSLEEIRQSCEGEQTCQIFADNSVFGDPCKRVTKFVKILYFCRAANIQK